MSNEHGCIHEDKFVAIDNNIEDIKKNTSSDLTASWVKWAFGLMFTAILAISTIQNNRLDRVDTAVEESRADRRSIAEKQSVIETRQVEQYNAIMAELRYLRATIDRQP